MAHVHTLVIGAGPAGLAAAGALRAAGVPFEVLERDATVGATWRRHYDRLHLHTVKRLSGLPGLPMPADYPKYPSRDQLVAYLEGYAAHFGIAPRFGTEVQRASCTGDGWSIETSAGDWTCQNLVVASGYNTVPNRPEIPGSAEFRGTIVHSSEYTNGGAWRGKRALVVGCGNSGGELAVDLHEHGATVAWVVRGPVHVIPLNFLGRGAQETGLMLSRLPLWLADRLGVMTSRLVYGDLSAFGIRRPERGPLELVWSEGRVSILDVGTIALVRQGRIQVVPALERLTPEGGVFADGTELPLDLVVLATGFRCRVPFLDGVDGVVNERGVPRWHGLEAPVGRLWFVGYRNPPTGGIREMAIEADRVAAAIAARGLTP